MLSTRKAKAIGSKGGKRRKRNLSPERRREIAQKAAAARWHKSDGQPAVRQ